MLKSYWWFVVPHVIIVSAPVQRIWFWGFSDLIRTLGSGLGLDLDYFNKTKYFRLRLSDKVRIERPETDLRMT